MFVFFLLAWIDVGTWMSLGNKRHTYGALATPFAATPRETQTLLEDSRRRNMALSGGGGTRAVDALSLTVGLVTVSGGDVRRCEVYGWMDHGALALIALSYPVTEEGNWMGPKEPKTNNFWMGTNFFFFFSPPISFPPFFWMTLFCCRNHGTVLSTAAPFSLSFPNP